MDITLGKRNAYFCNLKLLLIVLVVYGHLIEKQIWEHDFLMWQYRFIYSVHMPLFAFLSGVFLKGKQACLSQCKKALQYYFIFQTAYIGIMKVIQGGAMKSLAEPYWHLWYLLSLAGWALICLGLEYAQKYLQEWWKKAILILACIGLACAAGMVRDIDRTLSLSRLLVFLPYVLMGRYFPAGYKPHRLAGAMAGALSTGLVIIFAKCISVTFLYQADSYAARGMEVEMGIALRLLSYVIAIGLGWFLMAIIPQRRLSISKIGVNTLWIYILHGPVVLRLREMSFWANEFAYVAGIVAIIIVWAIYKCFQWKCRVYKIVQN